MNMPLFAGSRRNTDKVRLPASYRRHVAWMPQIGDVFPDFTALTTHGEMEFFQWAEGSWTVLFSHPCAFTPVCSTEVAALAEASEDFARRGVKLLAFTMSPLMTQAAWHREVEALFGVSVDFPSVVDPDGELGRIFGMIHDKEGVLPGRRTMLLDPSMRIRAILDYPVYVGRSTDELLRIVDAVQAQDRWGAQTPADWQEGEMLIVPQAYSEADCLACFGAVPTRITPYMQVVHARTTPPDVQDADDGAG